MAIRLINPWVASASNDYETRKHLICILYPQLRLTGKETLSFV